MTRFFVLWRDSDDNPVWDGPYETFEGTLDCPAISDRNTHTFVTMTVNWRPEDR